ncbi:hypothetical protein V2J09_021153 [Rumex salicifolius]
MAGLQGLLLNYEKRVPTGFYDNAQRASKDLQKAISSDTALKNTYPPPFTWNSPSKDASIITFPEALIRVCSVSGRQEDLLKTTEVPKVVRAMTE